jgi:hypothetical protein
MRSSASVLALIVAIVCTSGCTRRLIIQPDDNAALAAGKIAVRVPLAVFSLGFSEMMADCVRETARETGLPTTPTSPVWDICNGRSDIAAHRAGLAAGAQGMAEAQERERERQLQERAVLALERASEPPLTDFGQHYKPPVNCETRCRYVGSERVCDSTCR